MNQDVLECKRKAQELITSDRAPVNGNGRKKGYIEVMKDLWDAKGYGHLGLKPQNLRDQASRLEKIQEGSVDISFSNSRAMSGIDEPMYGGGTQSASNINRLDSADLFGLDVQTDGVMSRDMLIRKEQQEAICIRPVPVLALQKSLETQSCWSRQSRTIKTMSVCRGVCQSIMLLSHL